MSEDRLTQELRSILGPLGVTLEAEPPKIRCTRLYQIPGILSLTVTSNAQGASLVTCRPHRRRTLLSREQLHRLDLLLKQVRQYLPIWIPASLSMEEEANCEIADEPLRLEPAWQQREGTMVAIVWLIAATPCVPLTRDLLESLLIAVSCRLSWLADEEAMCFYAIGDLPPYAGIYHLMLPDRRSVCHPALCGAYAPESDLPWSGHWFLVRVPRGADPQDDVEARGAYLCPACLTHWQTIQQEGAER